MKRSLLITMDYAPMHGGVAAYWSRVTEGMPEGKWVVLTSVLTPEPNDGKNIIRLPLLTRWFWPRWLIGVKRVYDVFRGQRCDQIIVGQLLPIGAIAYLLYKLVGIPYVVQVYGMDIAAARQHTRKLWLAKRVLLHARWCVANSQATAMLAQELGVPSEKIVVVYPIPKAPQPSAAKVAELRTIHGLSTKRVIVTVGRLVPRKGQDLVIDALPDIIRRLDNVVYVVVGDGSERKRLEALAAERGVPVIFTGAVNAEERDAWFAVADVFVMAPQSLPGDIEGFGMVYLEAGAVSKPVVAAATGGVAEAVEHQVTGLLVEPSVASIGTALSSLLSDTPLSQRLGHGGRTAFEQRWSWSKQLENLKQALV